MAKQSRVFVCKYAFELLRLIAQIKRMGMDQELGDCSIDAHLDALASGEE